MKKRIVITLLISLMIISVFAKDAKVVYVNTQRVMAECKLTQEAQQKFQLEQQKWEQKIADLDKKIQRLSDEYDTRKLTLTQEGKKEAQAKIEELYMERQQFAQQIYGQEGEAAKKNAELLQPILAKMQTILQKLSIENNYDFILDSSMGSVLYAQPSLEITDLVIERLNETSLDEE